jgi:hypothetical protein
MSTALAIPSPSRPFRFTALLWKEWRQQRMVIALVAALPTLLFCVTFPVIPEAMRAGAILIAGAVLCLVPAILGSSAFCNEEDDRSVEFLRCIPTGDLRLFVTKMLPVVSGTMLSALLLVVAMGVICPAVGGTESRGLAQRLSEVRAVEAFPAILGIMSLGILAAPVSTWVRRTLPCIFVTPVVFAALAAVMALISYPYCALYLPRPPWLTAEGGPFELGALKWLIWWPASIGALLILAGSFRFWAWGRLERTFSAKFWRTALFLAVLPTVCVAPLAGRYSYYTYIASPKAFWDRGWADIGSWSWSETPSTGPCALLCRCPEWGVMSRVALINPVTGEWRGLTRSRSAYGFSLSPSEDKVVFTGRGALWQSWQVWQDEMRPFQYCVADLSTNTVRELSELSDESRYMWPMFLGWYDDNTVAFSHRGGVSFINTSDGTARDCQRKGYIYNPRVVASRAVFMVSEDLLEFRPDLDQPKGYSLPSGFTYSADITDAAKDAHRVLLATWPTSEEPAKYGVMDLQGETPAFRRLPADVLPPPSDVLGLAWDGRVVIQWRDSLVLYEPRTDAVSPIPIKTPLQETRWRVYSRLSSSKRFVIVTLDTDALPVKGKESMHYTAVVDLESGKSVELPPESYRATWTRDDKLVALETSWGKDSFWLMERDGSNRRRLFPGLMD